MQTTMTPGVTIQTPVATIQTTCPSKGQVRTGWGISVAIIAFMLFDAIGKLVKPVQVADAFARTGWPIELSVPLGIILLVCTVFYSIPRTSVLGALLLTGYLGGAVATNLRLENPLFTNTLFPVYFGVLVWGGLWLREPRLRELIPLLK
jgi:DoxX-like protein